MIEVRRQGKIGNLLESDGAVLVVNFGGTVVRNLFRGKYSQIRYAQQRAPTPTGFAPEDKLWIFPKDDERLAPKEIKIETDPGGDIFLYLGEKSGLDFVGSKNMPLFPVGDISDNPSLLLERGIEMIALPSLSIIENERSSRIQWGLSTVDETWSKTVQ